MAAGAPTGRSRENEVAEPPSEVVVTEAADAVAGSWTRFVDNADSELYHDYRWRSVIERVFGQECRYFMAADSLGAVRGVLPLVRLRSRLFGDFLASVPYFNYGGLLADSPHIEHLLLDAAVRCASELGVSHIELRHRDRHIDWPARDDKVALSLSLPSSEGELWKSFDSKLRSQIRRPQKAGATCRVGGEELIADFYRVFSHNMRDLGTPVYPRSFFSAIVAAFPREATVFVVDLADRPVAAALVLRHRSSVEIPWASSLREANREGVNMLLYWSVLQAAIAQGATTFDFGRSTKDSGTYRFKLQWGATAHQLRWHYWLAKGGSLPQITPNNPKYRLAIAAWQRLPLPLANFIGPRIARNLP